MTRQAISIPATLLLIACMMVVMGCARYTFPVELSGIEVANQALVVSVKGEVEYCPVGSDPDKDENWKPVKEEMKLSLDVEVFVADGSELQIIIGERDEVTVVKQNSFVLIKNLVRK